MSFRKRNIALSSTESSNFAAQSGKTTARGVRVSPVTAHPTVSTGTVSLDKLLSLGVGQALGTSLLIGEEGTTDFASALLRCYAAEALMHGHKVLVVAPEGWANSLPGVVEDRGSWKEPPTSQDSEKMKIAWRYERLGAHGEQRKPPVVPHRPPSSTPPQTQVSSDPESFCHPFDLTKRLQLSPGTTPPTHVMPTHSPGSPFASILTELSHHLSNRTSTSTRLIIPSLLSPLFYPPSASNPTNLLPFLHTLRSLLRQHSSTLSVIASYPLTLYPRSSILTRWTERLIDGVITLHPFPHSYSVDASQPSSHEAADGGGRGKDDEKMQGLLKVIKLPILSERGLSVGAGEDMAFAVGRRRFVIRPFYLPPLDGDGDEEESKGKELEF